MQYVNTSPAFLLKNGLQIKAFCQYKLDQCGQYVMRIIFIIDPKSYIKLFITPQETFTCSRSTRQTL